MSGDGRPRVTGPLLNDEQLVRYSRQILLDEVGVEGQRRLLEARVLVVGAGGLGAPAAIYLAAAGVGTLGIVDADRVDLSNLHRQVIHFNHDIGRPKTQSARRTLEDINPDVRVIEHRTFLSSANALEIISQYDLVVNGCDNFATRYLVNDACVLLGKPLVDACILKWEGQVTVFRPGQGCYRCLYPTPPPPGAVPSCAEGGIIGALAGHMGTAQAIEAIKLLLGVGKSVTNRLILYDALEGQYRSVRWRRDPDCPVCGDRPTITQLIDYEAFCGLPQGAGPAGQEAAQAAGHAGSPASGSGGQAQPPALSPAEAQAFLAQHPEAQLIDVREPGEYRVARIPGARLIPKGEVPQRLTEIDPARPAVIYCRSGRRSAEVVTFLVQQGYGQVFNLAGGILAWENQQLPVESGAAEPAAPARGA